VGTPAATTRGFGESECKDITNWICDICDDLENTSVVDEVRAKVEELCSRFPVYK
jgi:glycine hydroxymethyltransferase